MLSSSTDAGLHARAANTLPAELKLTARLGVPLAIGELGWMSTYIVDALMIGRLPHSATGIAASSLGNTIFYAIAFSAIALMTGIETLVAQAYGRGDLKSCSHTFAQSVWITAAATLVVTGATLGAIPLLPKFGIPPDITVETERYLHALVWSAAPLLLYWTVRRYLQSIDRVLFVMISLLTAGVVNFAADWAFLFGHLGLRPQGIAGSGWATCLVRVYTVTLVMAALYRAKPRIVPAWNWAALRPDWLRLRQLLELGWPAGLKSLADLGVSTYMSILCARLGATLLAAHQVVLDLDAFVYMVPLGLSYATATRVGQSAGRKSMPQVRRAANASLLLGMGFISIAAVLFASFAHLWAGLYTNDGAVVAAAAPIFLLCGFLQFGDAAGIVLEAALVGVGDTRSPLLVNTTWYWALGMPLSYVLTFHHGGGVEGLWVGRAIAAIGSAVTLTLIWKIRIRGRTKRSTLPVSYAAGS